LVTSVSGQTGGHITSQKEDLIYKAAETQIDKLNLMLPFSRNGIYIATLKDRVIVFLKDEETAEFSK
jgi:hypothetical protein